MTTTTTNAEKLQENNAAVLSMKDLLEAFYAHIIDYDQLEEILNEPVRTQLKRVREFRRYRIRTV